MKIKTNHIFPNSLHSSFLSVTQRPFSQNVTYNWFDGVLGGVTGVVYSVLFGVLLTLVNFTLDAILHMTTFGSNSYLVFSR